MQCLLCGSRAVLKPGYDENNTEVTGVTVDCAACGAYALSIKAQKALHMFIADNPADIAKRRLEKLAAYIREHNRVNEKPPAISPSLLEEYGIR